MSWIQFEHEGRMLRVAVVRDSRGVWVGWPGRAVLVQPMSQAVSHEVDENEVRAPMTGKIVKVMVAPGDRVEEGDVLVILEAMKMEYRLSAPRAAVVASTHCKEGTQVELGALLVSLGRG